MRRLTLQFPPQLDKVLDELADEESTTKADVVRRALALYDHLHKQGVKRGGKRKLTITDESDKTIKEIVF